MSLDLIPMLLLSLLLMTAGGDVSTVRLVLSGDHHVADAGAIIVGDATLVVPAGTETAGPIHLIAGETRIEGTVRGDVTQIAGTLEVAEGARITGTFQHIGGALAISPDAEIGRRTAVDLVRTDPSPAERVLPVALLTLLLAFAGARWARRRPEMLDNVQAAAAGHPLISVTVGLLVAVTFLSLFVFMAFTLVLLPVSLLGLAGGLLILGYGVVALGYETGRRLPIRSVGAATAGGVVAVMVALQLLGAIPVVGDLLVGLILLAALGAVLITYFGLQEFTPVAIPE
jgi:hypothetical protein